MRKFVFGGSYASVVPLLLDLYPATAAYSLRKLRTAYTGASIRVRRSSDNTEQDIGFVGKDLDTASLLSFVGVGDGFITTWYDQQGSFNISQTSLSSQPRIVDGGTIETKGSIPAIKFDGSNDFLIRTTTMGLSGISFFSVSAAFLVNTVGVIHSQSNTTTNTIRTLCDSRITPNRNMIISTPTNYFADLSIARNNTNQRLLTSFIDSSNNMSAFDNGATGGTDTYAGTPINNIFQLGKQDAALNYLNGYIQEFIYFNTNQSANRLAIESNINTYYGIY